MIKIYTVIFLLFNCLHLPSQTIQFKFCGKTDMVNPSIDPVTGKDQRNKATLKLDYLKIGLRGASQTNPFYILGDTQTGSVDFADVVLTDGCTNTIDTLGTCVKCSTCKNALSSTLDNLGNSLGNMVSNVLVESKGNDMLIKSTGASNLVCYETNKISLTGQANKKIDVNYKVEGISDSVNLKNMSLNYRYNSDAYFSSPYFFNKNSSIVGVFDEVGSIQASVPLPSSTEETSNSRVFSISVQSNNDELKIITNSLHEFSGNIKIIDLNGSTILSRSEFFNQNTTESTLKISTFSSGLYFLQITDQFGKIVNAKFHKL